MDETASRNPSVPERLRAAAQLFEERNRAYGGNYLQFGKALMAMFPQGIHVDTEEEMRRLALLVHMMTKQTRYGQALRRGGHADSLEDMAVYAIMAAETDAMETPRAQSLFPLQNIGEESDPGDEWRRDR